MGILRGNRHGGRGAGAPQRLGARPIERLARDLDDGTLGRCEAQAIVTRAVASDPYAAWLERREAERRQRERPEIRWVYRPPRSAGASGGAAGAGTRDACGRGPGSTEDGLVGVA
jgi:hypothetical protein